MREGEEPKNGLLGKDKCCEVSSRRIQGQKGSPGRGGGSSATMYSSALQEKFYRSLEKERGTDPSAGLEKL